MIKKFGKNPALLITCFIVLIDMIGFGVVLPILPYYVKSFGASALQLSWLVAIFSLLQFLMAPVWGRMSDVWGRKPVFIISILGSIFSFLFLGFSTSYVWLLVGRALAGLCTANLSVAYASIADVTSEEDRASGMGLVGACFGIGLVLGPVVGGTLSVYGYSFPMFFAAVLSVINLIFTVFYFSESHRKVPSAKASRFDKKVFSNSKARGAIIMFFFIIIAVTQVEVAFAIFLKDKFQIEAKEAGFMLAFMGILMAISQIGLVGRLAKKFGEARLIQISTSIAAVALYFFATTSIFSLLIGMLGILALSQGILFPALSTMASLGAKSEDRGSVMGVYQSAGSLARVIGPPLAGWLYDAVRIEAPMIAAAVLLFVIGVLGRALLFRDIPKSSVSDLQ